MENKCIRKTLEEMAEPDFRDFEAKLLPGVKNIIGVRLPVLRKIGYKIAQEDFRAYVMSASDKTFEEIMLQGMVIGYAKTGIEEKLQMIANFIPKIDNWSVCDSFCSGLKMAKVYRQEFWEFINIYLSSFREYELRFGIVMIINYYIDEIYIKDVLKILDNIKNECYYVKMAAAWAVSICYVKFQKITSVYLDNSNLDDFTYNKSLQKIIESRAVDKNDKEAIRKMKRKL